jgi:hypothetical protein
MKWRTFDKALALALIGQAVVRIALTGSIGADLFRSSLRWSSSWC